MSDLPPPSRPYRGSAILHGVLALMILVFAAISGGAFAKALVVAVAYFIAATGWTWFRFRRREARTRATATAGHPSSNGSGSRS